MQEYILLCVPRVNRVEYLNPLTKELSTQVHGVVSTLSFSSTCVLTGMTHPSLWCCDCSTAMPESCRHSFGTAIRGPTWMNGFLWLLSLSLLFVVKANRESKRQIGVGNGLMHGSSVSVTSAVNACGCLMFPLTASDQRLCVGMCLCQRVWCNVNVFGS